MKKVLNIFVLAICFISILGIKAFAATTDTPLTVLSNKVWTITLNTEVDESKDNLDKYIYVYQEDTKQRVPIKVWVDTNDKRKIYVSPNGPATSYKQSIIETASKTETDYSSYLPDATWKVVNDYFSNIGVGYKGIGISREIQCPNGEYENNKNFTLVVGSGLKAKNGGILKSDITKRFRALRIYAIGRINCTVPRIDETIDISARTIGVRTTPIDQPNVSEQIGVSWEKTILSFNVVGGNRDRVRGRLINFDPTEPYFTVYYNLLVVQQ